MEVHKTHSSANPDATGSTDLIPQPVETSIAQRPTPIWCCGEMSLVDSWNQVRKREKPEARAFPSVRMQRGRHARAHAHKFPQPGAATACGESSRSSRPTTVLCRTTPGKELFTHPGHVGRCSRHDGSNQCGGKGASYLRSLGGGRTLASMETEEGDLPHRRRTSNSCTGRGNTTRQKQRNCHRVSTQVFLAINRSG